MRSLFLCATVFVLLALWAPAASAQLLGGKVPINERPTWTTRSATRTTVMDPFGIVLHHTAVPGRSSFSDNGAATTIRGMQNFHMDTRGWRDIAYHFIVDHEGQLWRGVASPTHRGTHVGGANTGRIGIVSAGNLQGVDPFTDAMFDTLAATVSVLAEEYGISLTSYPKGHRDFGTTNCPGSTLYNRMAEIRAAAIGGPSGGPSPNPDADCTSSLPNATHGACTDGTNPGRCMPTATCSGAGGISKRGLCPGPNDIRCCFNGKCGCNEDPVVKDPRYNANCESGGSTGACINANSTNCPGTVRRGLCPGPTEGRCCFVRACVLSSAGQAAAGLGIMAATAAGVGGFYYSSKKRHGLANAEKEASSSEAAETKA